ncbi:nitrilase-related carbon-nitrogen hydrolase [Microbacterium radiodurans]|uniref:Carbon-nitrogen hydrolase n=1 Tax=Microbacterium radiodurans TaxID=661398 RepID=A0A5J5IUX4_9MICO|nr:nitrilase-related carbon-nitrogen hydrolase [Microbacterium radiodurans]KAA9090004.1 carbon-nitrogen hydrolase [Microbacterium radiodurans]
MVSRELRVAAASPPIRVGEVAANLAASRSALTEAVDAGAQLIVLPELATSGYVFRDRGEARAAALTADDPRWSDLSTVLPEGVVAVVGFAEDGGDRLFTSAAVLTRTGIIGGYRKAHLWGEEARFFARGDAAGAVVATPIGRLGVALCYDNEFPEVPRRLALAGAEILALPVNWPRVPRPTGERPPETIQAMAAARSSRLATVIADRHGEERGVEWTGGTAIVDDDGWIAAAGVVAGDGIVVETLTLRHPDDKALPPYNDLFGDRRPELYR